MKTISSKMSGITIAKILFLSLGFILGANTLRAQSPRDLFRRVMPSVVIVHSEKKTAVHSALEPSLLTPSIGSGALISADGQVLTSASVVQGAKQVEVEFFNGNRVSARVVASSPFADVALLQLERVPEKASVAKLGDSSLTAIGDQVFMVGSSAGIAQSLDVSWVSARLANEKTADAPVSLELLQFDAAVKAGNSGGPVFNLKGEVIGIVSHTLTKSNNAARAGLAVTSNVARKLMLEDRRVK